MQSNNIVNQKEYKVTQEDITRMAREAGFVGMDGEHGALRRFAALVADYERKAMQANGWRQCAVGQRTTQFCGQVEQAVAAEREACAKVADIGNDPRPASNPERYLPGVNTASKLVTQDIAYKIRARSMK